MKTEINKIPAAILDFFNAKQAIVVTSRDLGETVLGTATFAPENLVPIKGFNELNQLRKQEYVYSITMCMLELNDRFIEEATSGFENRFRIIAELDTVLRHHKDVYVVYVVTHFNFEPCNELTVFVGGDCYRTDKEIKDLHSIMSRTKDLAQAMIRKAVMVFPDIPTLHGGKKGEWIVLDRNGDKIEGISDQAIVALGTLIIPKGIKFLNDYKEARAREKRMYMSFPSRNYIRPDTASPDVLSGPNWKTMCEVWNKRELNLSYVTCLPDTLGGPFIPSSYPTGFGAVATAMKLISYKFPQKDIKDIRFLLEALGGVGQATVKSLIQRGVTPQNITAFDKSAEVCKRVADTHGIKTFTMSHEEFYKKIDAKQLFDVWINNGEGDNTRPEHVEKLLQSGIKIFCGAANNLFKRSDNEDDSTDDLLKQASLNMIFDRGAWAWPDEATSGGGWTLAVVDVLTRSMGKDTGTEEARDLILSTITTRNENLVDAIVGELQKAGKDNGKNVWNKVKDIIDERVHKTRDLKLTPEQIFPMSDVTKWKLS